MGWKQKALLQKAIAGLPSRVSYSLYYVLQKRFGGLKNANPVETLRAGVRFIRYLHRMERSVAGKNVLELGTGRQMNLPFVFWMAGAAQILTLDKNPYLKEELVLRDLAFMRRNREQVLALLGDLGSDPDVAARFKELLAFRGSFDRLLAMTHVSYMAPADAAALPLAPGSIDYHVSFSVFQHIPPGVLEGILREGSRILREDGLLLCYANMTDHFAHDDDSICLMNFLRYSDGEWSRLAGNRYMYQNRLRVDDLVRLFGRMGYSLATLETTVDERSLRELEAGFPVDERFAGKSSRVNATYGAWFIAEPVRGSSSRRPPDEAEKLCARLQADKGMSFRSGLCD